MNKYKLPVLKYRIVSRVMDGTLTAKILYADKDGFEILYLKTGFKTQKEANESMDKKIELINKMIYK